MDDRRDDAPKAPDRTLVTNDGTAKLPSVEALVGADAPCDPIPPPPEERTWDSDRGRWIRPGPSVPPDPAGVSFAPGQLPRPAEPLGLDAVEDPADVAVPWWGIAIVGAMFVVGLAVGLLSVMM
ncbi:MAG: hypothetical protein H6737_29060 [Alphaproteobacteria bacterium]|nr:hypothetical protein [Alphaproteobacteria bacterium]